MSDPIMDGELVRVAGVPSDITLLIAVDVQQQSQEDLVHFSPHQYFEQLLPVNHIEGLAEVHGTPIHCTALPIEEVNDSRGCPSAHHSAGLCMESELK